MGQEISFEVEGRPPAKSGQSVFGARHSHGPRVLALLSAARDEAQRLGFHGFGLAPIGLELRVACDRDHHRSDATNYLGGVSDVLDHKARRTNLDHLGDLARFGLYADDGQIEEVRFAWEASESPSYAVRLWAHDLTRACLKADGFVGWVPFKQMLLQDRVPRAAGIYVVARSLTGDPRLLPILSEKTLRAHWVDGAEIVYIGAANNLRSRLRQFAEFGASKPAGHRGGRRIWQLRESKSLLVAWKETPREVPAEAEAALIAEFRHRYGKTPFAN